MKTGAIVSAPSPTEDLALLALWEQVEARFDEEQVHASFLAACSERKNLAFAAVRYRKVQDEGPPERRELAQSTLVKITALALAQIEASRSELPRTRRIITIIAAIVSFGLIGFCLYLVTM